MDGQPFFVVTREVDPGLLTALREDIVPRLEREVPNQPTLEDLSEEPQLHRFTLIFDREGYSPEFFKEMQTRRIACVTYHKNPTGEWPEKEFKDKEVMLGHGAIVKMKLAERTLWFEDLELEVREVRKLSTGGHQTSVLATDYVSDIAALAGEMFSRWTQENFFGYMMQQFNLDRLIDHCVDEVPATTRLVNPDYRQIDGKVRSKAALLSRKLATFGEMTLKDDIEPDKVEKFCRKKTEIEEEIRGMQKEIIELKAKRKETPHHTTFDKLPAEAQFYRLSQKSKHFIDTIKMIAYRAETAMANALRENMSHENEARRLLQSLYRTEADLIPDREGTTLHVCLHPLANKANDEAIRKLCDEMSSAEIRYPGTPLRLIFKMGSYHNLRDRVA
jgi:hypothetical protein